MIALKSMQSLACLPREMVMRSCRGSGELRVRDTRAVRARPRGTMKDNSEACDFIIVGAGSAGCVLANRLTASGRHRVLLLEAGGHDRHFWIHVPLGYGKLLNDARG